MIEKAEDLPAITMQDMISKFIGIETEGGEIVSVIPKGTLYPTHEVFRQIFQTNRSGQQVYELPIYESEAEGAPKEKWEWIGVVRNTKLPPGLPKSSDIMVEMSVDRDGILYVMSYLKNDPLKDDPEKGTLEQHSFHFGGADGSTGISDDVFRTVDFHMFMFEAVCEIQSLRKYARPENLQMAQQLIEVAQRVLRDQNRTEAEDLAQRMLALRKDLPAPIEEMFWAQLITNNRDVVNAVERSNVEQLIRQIDTAAARNDFDTANKYLMDLRSKNEELLEKYPSDLLMRK